MQHFRSFNESEGAALLFSMGMPKGNWWLDQAHHWQQLVDTYEYRVSLHNLQVMLLEDDAAHLWDRLVFAAEALYAYASADNYVPSEVWGSRQWFEDEEFDQWPWPSGELEQLLNKGLKELYEYERKCRCAGE